MALSISSGAAPLLATVVLDVPRKQGQSQRKAIVQIRSRALTLAPRSDKGPHRRPAPLTLVEVREMGAPAHIDPLRWLLWTTEPADTPEQALAIVVIYKLRWKIEEFHLILKSGCRIEALEFETAPRLAKVVALYAPVAVRILQLRDWSRLRPDAPCTLVLSDEQWRALWTYIHKARPLARTPPPTLKQATLWIGRLGGHLGRKSDAMPGVRTLWRGWRDLELLATMYALDST